MQNINSNDLRTKFLEYFAEHNHSVVPSSSLIPNNDPTLLFVNAGMVQFKDVFLGSDKRPYTRATSSQRCVRAGGKHNDLENVGYTARHHTFFEMLGNFSFGDYFKKEAIQFAWTFLTDVLAIPEEKLWITVFEEDKESEDIWLKEMGVDKQRFSRCGEKDNFWSMGDTGPCGPCTEIFYDHGPNIAGGPPGSPEEDGDRYVEIWNLVFMQYDRSADGQLTLLPSPCVDTGMGLERIAAVLQGVHNNYDIDLFQHLLNALAKIINFDDTSNSSMRVIVDHIRSAAFLVVDGVVPSNEGRGYVLRRIIRRALRHGYQLGQNKPFFYKMVRPLVQIMGDAYPALMESQKLIEKHIKQEESQFLKTLEHGLKLLDNTVKGLKDSEIPGDIVFQLYDTYGFPVDLTADFAREKKLTIDQSGFEQAMQAQREQSQKHQRFKVDLSQRINVDVDTKFVGYEKMTSEAVVNALFKDGKKLDVANEGEEVAVVLDQTPFYAESGGQVGDSGLLTFEGGEFQVLDTQKSGNAYLHYGVMKKGSLRTGDAVCAIVDDRRQAIQLNHSATHLLHEALRNILGDHVAQKGSLVESDKLRFDFSHTSGMTQQEIIAVERLVNEKIRANLPSETQLMSIDEAKNAGAMALFGEKYADEVRVIKMGAFSHEICGGTHVARSGEIGLFKITSEQGCAAGIRRIEAVTGAHAINYIESQQALLEETSHLLKTSPDHLYDKTKQLTDQVKLLTKEVAKLQQQMAAHRSGNIDDHIETVGDVSVIAMDLGSVDRDTLRKTMDQLRSKHKKAAILLAAVKGQKIVLVASVTKNCLAKFNAPDLLQHVAVQVGGKGGGRDDMAQGGGEDPSALPQALASVADWVKQKLGS